MRCGYGVRVLKLRGGGLNSFVRKAFAKPSLQVILTCQRQCDSEIHCTDPGTAQGWGGVLALPPASWLPSAGHLAPLGCSFSAYKMRIKEHTPPRRCWMNPGNCSQKECGGSAGPGKQPVAGAGDSGAWVDETHPVTAAGPWGGKGEAGKGPGHDVWLGTVRRDLWER